MFKITTQKPEERRWHCSSVFILSFEHISPVALVFRLLSNRRVGNESYYISIFLIHVCIQQMQPPEVFYEERFS